MRSQHFDEFNISGSLGNTKLTKLINILKGMQSAVLAYSGGVDSTLLLKALQISKIRTLAITAASEIVLHDDLLMAKKMTTELGMEHRIIETCVLLKEEFLQNTPERCFFCKDELFRRLAAIASSGRYRVLIDGSNVDDALDYRPGMKAAAKYKVKSPLTEAGLAKTEIRELSKQLGLQTWNKPSSSCFASRFPYGQRITTGAIKRVAEAEEFLMGLGFHEVRVRDHCTIARIEVNEKEMGLLLLPEKRSLVSKKLKFLGYRFVSVDLDGYRTGSMNRTIVRKDSRFECL